MLLLEEAHSASQWPAVRLPHSLCQWPGERLAQLSQLQRRGTTILTIQFVPRSKHTASLVHQTQYTVIYRVKQTIVNNHHLYGASLQQQQLHVSDSSSVRHQEVFTVHTAMWYVIQAR